MHANPGLIRAAAMMAALSMLAAGCSRDLRDRPFEVPNGDLQGEVNHTLTLDEDRFMGICIQKHLHDGALSGKTFRQVIEEGRTLDTAYHPSTESFDHVRAIRYGSLSYNEIIRQLGPHVTFNDHFFFFVAVQHYLRNGDSARLQEMTLGQLLDDGREHAAQYRLEQPGASPTAE
ncbi:MAG TPA: hypothetical protein VHI13_04100 [Candidatus Kapabacteria bacterium]|nr:hypothetical protein [Candidatus Kapabacteria bacterium]